MAQDVERVGVVLVARGQDLNPVTVGEGLPEVANVPVRADEDRLLREFRADGTGGVETRRALGKFQLRVVGKDDLHEGAGYFRPSRGPACAATRVPAT